EAAVELLDEHVLVPPAGYADRIDVGDAGLLWCQRCRSRVQQGRLQELDPRRRQARSPRLFLFVEAPVENGGDGFPPGDNAAIEARSLEGRLVWENNPGNHERGPKDDSAPQLPGPAPRLNAAEDREHGPDPPDEVDDENHVAGSGLRPGSPLGQ